MAEAANSNNLPSAQPGGGMPALVDNPWLRQAAVMVGIAASVALGDSARLIARIAANGNGTRSGQQDVLHKTICMSSALPIAAQQTSLAKVLNDSAIDIVDLIDTQVC